MGLDRFKKVPCGFAFVEYHHRIDALSAVANLTGTKLDDMLIRVELDAGFKPGRQYGRGTSGGQVRDDRGGGGGRKRRHSGGEGPGAGDEQRDQPRQQAPAQKFGSRWESPATSSQSNTEQKQTGDSKVEAGVEGQYGPVKGS